MSVNQEEGVEVASPARARGPFGIGPGFGPVIYVSGRAGPARAQARVRRAGPGLGPITPRTGNIELNFVGPFGLSLIQAP